MEHIKTYVSHRVIMEMKQKKERVTLPKYRNANVQQFTEYLDTIPWNFFMTGTTGYELTLPSARRLAQRYYNNLPTGSYFFWVGEKFELKDGYHIHGLIWIPGLPQFKPGQKAGKPLYNALIDYWQIATGNKVIDNDNGVLKWETWNRIDIQPFMKSVGAHGYCAKYINKKKADYDLLTKREKRYDPATYEELTIC